MRRGLALALTLAALPACNRDTEVPPKPSAQPLAVVPAFESVAPQQGWTFAATGGVGPYTFAFAQGSPLSGTGASVDPSGVYTAGANGSAQDVLEVTDARGSTAIALVSVGQKIAINPAFTGTVPGGRISFQATGGDPLSYAFVEGLSGSGGGVTAAGSYTAGSAGDAVDTVIVQDRFGAAAKAEVHVGSRLTLYRSETRPVAPHESVTFIAFGGQPPYTFSVDSAGSGADAHIDATSGVYVVGTRAQDLDPSSATTDVIRVTDSAFVPQGAAIDLPVGARLSLGVATSQVFPGTPVQLLAGGGKPPYTFGFAARIPAVAGSAATDPDRTGGGNGGNRSRGTVNALSGEYVPGFSPGAVDFLQVSDATGAPASVLQGPAVGGVPIAIGSGVQGCAVADLNGDQSQDLVLAIGGDGNRGKFTAVELLDTATPFVQSYFTTRDPGAPKLSGDFTGAGRDQVLVLGGDQSCSAGSFCPAPDVWALRPDFAGYLSQQQVLGGDPQQVVTVLNDPAFQNGSNTAYHQVTTNYGIRNGTGFYDAARAVWHVFADGQIADTVQSPTFFFQPVCQDPTRTPQDRMLVRLDWPVGAAAPTPVCLEVKGFCPTCTGSTFSSAMAFAAGDFDGDGKIDLAWILQTEPNQFLATGASAKLFVALAAGADPAGLTTLYPAANVRSGWPAGTWSFDLQTRDSSARLLTLHPPAGSPPGTPDALLVRLRDDATGRGQLFLARDPSAPWIGPFDPAPSGPGAAGVRAYVPAPGSPTSYLSWSGNDGTVSGFGVAFQPSLAFTPASTAASFPFAVNTVCLPDVNGDGAPDLVAASDVGGTAQLVIGDGTVGASPTGTFGAQVHQRGGVFPLSVGDLDGDGFGDAVVADAGSGVSVLWGGGGMLAWGDQLSAAPVSLLVVEDWFGTGGVPSILYQEKAGGFGLIRNRGDGTFDPPVAVSGESATGGAPGTYFYAFPARLGTSRPGPDAFALGNSGGVAALLVQAAGVVVLPLKPAPPLDPLHTGVKDCWPAAVGADQPAVVLACDYENRSLNGVADVVALFGATIQNPDAAPGPGGPAFTDWVLLTSTTASGGNAFASAPPAGFQARVTVAGTQAQPGSTVRDTALFVMQTDRLYAVEVRMNAPAPSPAGWPATVFPVTPATVSQPFIAASGRMEAPSPTYAFTIVAAGDAGTDLLRRTTGGYALVQHLSSRAFPLGIAPLSSLGPGQPSPGDVVTFVGDFNNTGLTPEVVPRLNDGTGKLK